MAEYAALRQFIVKRRRACETPNKRRKTPKTRGVRVSMDTLSLILTDIRLHGAIFREAQLSSPWALRLHTPGLTSFHIITRGEAWLLREGADPLKLQTGDIVMLPGGIEHRVQDDPTTRVTPHDRDPEHGEVPAEPLARGWSGAGLPVRRGT